MKGYLYLSIISLSLLLTQCVGADEVAPRRVDYDAESIKLMTELAPQIIGRWDLKRVSIKAQSYNNIQKEAGITKDTVFQDFATLNIQQALVASSSPQDFRHPDFEGTIAFRGKTYPIAFQLMANAERIIHNKGPQVFFLFQYNFPSGTRIPEAEDEFLDDLGILDNYSLELVPRQPTMIWRGLNRGVESIVMQKQ